MPNEGNTITLSYLMNNGSVLTDTKARVVDTEVVSSNLEASSVPRRTSSKIYHQRGWNQPPTPGDEEQREVADPPYPENDSLYLGRTTPYIHTAGRAGMDIERGIKSRMGALGQVVAIGLAGLAFVSVAVITGMDKGEPLQDQTQQVQQAPAQPPPVILPGEGKTP